jgi:riboflavin-specific deaminase-like protein
MIRAAACNIPAESKRDQYQRFALARAGQLQSVDAQDSAALLAWVPDFGWQSLLDATAAEHALAQLYLPICSAHAFYPITVGHLGQSLDGFIANSAGDSYYVTGPENILHLHRMRALCDAVIVGAGTIEADDPRLTTRLVPGPNPLRVVLDPKARLSGNYRVFKDSDAVTLRACAAAALDAQTVDRGTVAELVVPTIAGRLDLADLIAQLRGRGCARIFVEGGGITVASFLEAGLLDRLQLTIAPMLIGAGRPALPLPARSSLSECLRVCPRIFPMGEDLLFDCDLRAARERAGRNGE